MIKVKSIDREPFLIAKDRLVGMRHALKSRFSTTARPMSSLRSKMDKQP